MQNGGMTLAAAYAHPLTTLFAPKVADYAAARPDYPAALFDWLAERVPAQPAVLDLGAGTGLLTQGLLARGWAVLAVEPETGMRAACDAALAGQAGYRSAAGQAEALPCADACLDLITAAQCFHWFDIPRARAECHRVLRPGGRIALVWNDRLAGDPLHQDMDAVFNEFGGAQRGALLAHEERDRISEFFTGPQELWEGPHAHGLGLDGLLALAFSRSYMPARDSATGQAASAALQQVFLRHAVAERVLVRYQTVCHLGA